MLQSLHVHNFALLEDAHADFTKGFNVFSGETGAGKSILIDAFGMVLGGRASADYIRNGTDGLWVQAVFDITKQKNIKDILIEHGIDVEDDLFLKRQLSLSGKSKSFVNGVQVPLSVLRLLGTALVDIHGQHENQALLHNDTPRILTDAFGGPKLTAVYDDYKILYKEYTDYQQKLAELLQDNQQHDLLLDRYNWEIQEIEDAALKAGEETALEEEARLLQNSEKLIKSINNAYQNLDSDDAVLSRLAYIRDELHYAIRYDESLKSVVECVDSAWISLDDCRTELSEYLSNRDFDEERACKVQERLDTIYRLHKKYGGSTEAVLSYLAVTKVRLEQLENIANTIAKVQQKLEEVTGKLIQAAQKLTKARQQSSQELSKLITLNIKDLAMPDGQFFIQVTPTEKFTVTGCDQVHFLFSANIGEPLNILEKVASGGELSRIALAIKTVLSNMSSVNTMVFDEIDTGVGGITAQRMAEKIANISVSGQVLCITHLPQIAAFADNHIHISKQSSNGRTTTTLTSLDYNARLQELVRMTAGDTVSRAAYESAVELLQSANEMKQKILADNNKGK